MHNPYEQTAEQRRKLYEKNARKIGGNKRKSKNGRIMSQRFFLENQPKAIKALRQGQTIYDVMAFIDKSGNCKNPKIDVLRVESRVYNTFDIGSFISASYISKYGGHRVITGRSLGDMGFSTEANLYNNHRMFTSRRKAERYIKELNMGIHTNKGRSRDDEWSDPYYDRGDF